MPWEGVILAVDSTFEFKLWLERLRVSEICSQPGRKDGQLESEMINPAVVVGGPKVFIQCLQFCFFKYETEVYPTRSDRKPPLCSS